MIMKLRYILNKSILLGLSSTKLVVYDRDTKKTTLTTNSGNILWEKQSLSGKAYFIDDRILFTPDEECVFVDLLTGKILDIYPIHHEGHNDNLIIGEQPIDDEDCTTTYNYKQKKVLWNNKYNISSKNLLNGNSFYSLRFDEYYRLTPVLFCFNIQTGNIFWQFSIQDFPSYINGFGREQEADIKQIIGVYNNLLWIYVGGWHLVGIDINSGKEVHHIENVLDLLGLNKEDRYHVNLNDTIHLNEQEGVLKMFAHRYYFEINLNTLQGEVIKDFGPNWNPDWRIKSSNYYQQYPNLLFFCGYYKATDAPNAFGIFDTEKAEIIWYDTTKDDLGYFYSPPQANDELLAILDDKQNLLIYESE
jgi:hypothetical protein